MFLELVSEVESPPAEGEGAGGQPDQQGDEGDHGAFCF